MGWGALRLQMALHSCKMARGHHLAAKEDVFMEVLRRMSECGTCPQVCTSFVQVETRVQSLELASTGNRGIPPHVTLFLSGSPSPISLLQPVESWA